MTAGNSRQRKSYRSQNAVVGSGTSTIREQGQSINDDWTQLAERDLLKFRICDLNLKLEDTPLNACVEQVYRELSRCGLKFRPHAWLSDEWFSPDGIPGIAIPFFLAHKRLKRLEKAQMLEVEGETRQWCLKILRHEIGHAYDTAFRLHRRKKYRQTFGRYHDPYPETYRPIPSSKKFVHHLEPWYAQSHPAEDFAETFAVWMTPRSNWREAYRGWPALAKLEYVDELMGQLQGQRPSVASRKKVAPAHRLKLTLGEYYQQKRAYYGFDRPSAIDPELNRLFASQKSSGRRRAASFLLKHQNELADLVCSWTGEYRYTVQQTLREMIDRCRELDLRAVGDVDSLKKNVLVMLAVHLSSRKSRGRQPVAL